MRGRRSSKRNLKALAGGADRIVVVDTETTGVYPNDRIVEIAMITLSLEGELLETWDTLVQPQRDVGATHIHGITPSMLSDAPLFGDIAGDVALRLDGACVAAHNLPFDGRMIGGEFARMNVDVSITTGIDTLRASRAALADACAQYGIVLDDAHRALADAMATADLLLRISASCSAGGPIRLNASLPRSARVYRREDTVPVTLPDPPFITRLATTLAHRDVEADVLAYLDLLRRCIEDLHLDAGERRQLALLAADLGLDASMIAMAHRRFVNELIDAAIADDQVTHDEYDMLVRVAAALDVDQDVVEQRTRSYRTANSEIPLTEGMRIVFTGGHPIMSRSQLTDHAATLGFEVQSGVTKKTDLLIAADPESNSGKAAKARRYGVPIVDVERFSRTRPGDTLRGVGSAMPELKVVTCPSCLATWTVAGTSRVSQKRRCDDCAAPTGDSRRER